MIANGVRCHAAPDDRGEAMRRIGDYHNAVIGKVTTAILGNRVTLDLCAELEALLESGSHLPNTSPAFTAVCRDLEAWIRAARQSLAGRAIAVEAPEPETERLRETLLAYCRPLTGREDGIP